MPEQREVEEQRKKLDRLVKQAKEDAKFRERMKKNPVGVLEEAGLSHRAIGDILREEGYVKFVPDDSRLSPEGKQAMLRIIPNIGLPCIWTDCFYTCWCSDCCISDI